MSIFFISLIKGINYSISEKISIFIISFVSNTFSALSGGGAGLIQLPMLIIFGIPYHQALASHKLATVALGIGGSLRNFKSLKNDTQVLKQLLIFGIPGVIFGSSLVKFIAEEYLYLILGLFSIFLALYSFRKSDFGLLSVNKEVNLSDKFRFAIIIFFIGILNGSISSGTGLLVTTLLIKTFGIDFLRAISLTFFTVGIFWNAVGALFLSKVGTFSLNLVIFLILGSFFGGFLGAHISILKGSTLVKKTFITVCLLVGISLLIKSFKVFYLD